MQLLYQIQFFLLIQLFYIQINQYIYYEGIANIQIEEQELIINENQSTFIPMGAKHRLSNYENYPLTIIEVQTGKYLGEDDIVRFEDKYGRII